MFLLFPITISHQWWPELRLQGIWLPEKSRLKRDIWLAFKYSEKAMAPHSSTFAWRIPWMEEPGRLQSMGSLESDTTERLHFHSSLSCIGEGNGNPLQCSCLENPRDGEPGGLLSMGSQSRTRLKRLSSSSSSSRHIQSFLKSLY